MQPSCFSLKLCDHIKKCNSGKTLRDIKVQVEGQKKLVKVRAQSTGSKASWKGRGGSEPERHFRSVWSADAQAHSSTLDSREERWRGGDERGREVR